MSIDIRYKHRMNIKKLTFVGTDGAPVKNREITVAQTKHKFLFGCSEFSAIPLAAACGIKRSFVLDKGSEPIRVVV